MKPEGVFCVRASSVFPVLPEIPCGLDEGADIFRRGAGRDGAAGIENKPSAGFPGLDEFLRGGAHLRDRSPADDSAGVHLSGKNMVGPRRGFSTVQPDDIEGYFPVLRWWWTSWVCLWVSG